MLSATDSHRHHTTKQFESQGKGVIGSFNVNISLSQQNFNWKGTESLLMQMKNVQCAWLCLAEQRAVGLPVMGDLLCLGFAFLCASAWVDSWGLLRLCCSHRYRIFSAPEK